MFISTYSYLRSQPSTISPPSLPWTFIIVGELTFPSLLYDNSILSLSNHFGSSLFIIIIFINYNIYSTPSNLSILYFIVKVSCYSGIVTGNYI